jgi:hypothetical protein
MTAKIVERLEGELAYYADLVTRPTHSGPEHYRATVAALRTVIGAVREHGPEWAATYVEGLERGMHAAFSPASPSGPKARGYLRGLTEAREVLA